MVPLKSAAFEKIQGISLQQEASVDWWESQKGCKGDESACIINNVQTLFSFSVNIRKQAKGFEKIEKKKSRDLQKKIRSSTTEYNRLCSGADGGFYDRGGLEI